MSELYNPEVKEEYLNGYDNEQTKTTLKHVFVKSAETEQMLNKDLYNFTLDEIGSILHNLNASTTNSIRSYGRFLIYYVDWAIKKGFRTSNISPFSGKDVSWFDQFIDKTRKLFYSEEEVKYMVNHLVNAQDAITLQAPFEGVEGQGMSELLNLRKQDVDFDNRILHLTDDKDGSERDLEVSEECIKLIRQALDETEYQKKNGHSEGRSHSIPLVENDYVFKSATTRIVNHDRADKHLVYRRLTIISDEFGYPYLNARALSKSGMIKMAKDLYIRDGKLENEQLAEIAERFGIRKIRMGKYEVLNYTLIRDYVNMENIVELYADELEQV